jgi:hypothetical protein
LASVGTPGTYGNGNHIPVFTTDYAGRIIAVTVTPLSITTEDDNTYSVSGTLQVPSGATGYLPPFFKVFAGGESVTLIGVRAMVRSGSCTVNIQQNGSNVTGLTAINVTTTPTTTSLSTPASVANGDYFAPVLTAVSSADGLSLTFLFGKTL